MDLVLLTGQRPADVLKLTRADIRDGALHLKRKRRPNPVLTPQTLSLSRRSFTADKSKCPGSKSSPHHARIS